MPHPIKVLVVDDSAIVRKLLADVIRGEPDMELVGVASDPFAARDLILRDRPDVLTLDIEMPRMDGITFLRRLMVHHPLPVIVVSSVTPAGSVASIEALRAGAIDVIPKPGGPHSVLQVAERLKARIRAARALPMRLGAGGRPAGPGEPEGVRIAGPPPQGVVAIGASTGGTLAIEAVLTRLPADAPPIVIVQHMPPGFTRAFAERLDRVCAMRVREAAGGEALEHGSAWVAPGGRHLSVGASGAGLQTVLRQGPPVHHQRPAVDVLFHSMARLDGVGRVGVLLTGMGADGADGLLALRRSGAETIAQDEASCVVFGMPREAITRDAATHVASLDAIPRLIYEALFRLAHAPARSL